MRYTVRCGLLQAHSGPAGTRPIHQNPLNQHQTTTPEQQPQPDPELFAVLVDGSPVPVKSVTVGQDTVVLRLRGKVDSGEQVQLSFTNTGTGGTQLRTIDRTPVDDFVGLGVANNNNYGFWGCLRWRRS